VVRPGPVVNPPPYPSGASNAGSCRVRVADRDDPGPRSAQRTLRALGMMLVLTAPGSGPESGAPPVPIETRPYAIRAWIAADPETRLDPRRREALIASWRTLLRRFVGAPWDVEIAEGDGPLAGAAPDALQPEAVAEAASGCDKAWLIRIEPAAPGWSLAGREFDATLGRLGPVRRRPAPSVLDAPRALLGLALDLFGPLAEIGPTAGGGVAVTVQAAALPAADPIARFLTAGSILRPHWIFFNPDGSVLRIREVPFTYLRVEGIDGANARCAIVSGLRNPLPKQVAGRYRLVALGIRPAAVPSRLRFVTEPDQAPAPGYVLTARSRPDGPARLLGTTDRQGRIALPAGFAEELVLLRLLAGDVEPLVEFPALPGEDDQERTIPVILKPQAVALEVQLSALRDEIVDQIARRVRLEARLKARADADAWDEVQALLEEYRKLPARAAFEDRLAQLKDEAARQQAQAKTPVLTRTAQAQVADTDALIGRYLNDEVYQHYLDARDQSRAAAPAKKAR
jgi:hypothetical protein